MQPESCARWPPGARQKPAYFIIRPGAERDVASAGFDDFDDYWRPFPDGQAPAPGCGMSLPAEYRDALRELRTEKEAPAALAGASWPGAAPGCICSPAR
jgi:hypothetical protein